MTMACYLFGPQKLKNSDLIWSYPGKTAQVQRFKDSLKKTIYWSTSINFFGNLWIFELLRLQNGFKNRGPFPPRSAPKKDCATTLVVKTTAIRSTILNCDATDLCIVSHSQQHGSPQINIWLQNCRSLMRNSISISPTDSGTDPVGFISRSYVTLEWRQFSSPKSFHPRMTKRGVAIFFVPKRRPEQGFKAGEEA